jgi:type IV pilus assembly protein PilQ
MVTSLKKLCGAMVILLGAFSVSQAQTDSPAPAANASPAAALQSTNPPPKASGGDKSSMTLVQASPSSGSPAANAAKVTTTTTTDAESTVESGGVGVREFQGDEIGQVLRLLARQAKVNLVVSEAVTGTVTMRLEDVTALQAIGVIVKAKGLFMDKIDGVYYVKTATEKTAEPTESDSYQFSYARAKDVSPLLASQLASKDPPQVDERTNTIFYRETRSNIDHIRQVLLQIDKPTRQVMIEARLVEVTADPVQAYGINWAGTVGSASSPKQFNFGGSTLATKTLAPLQNVVTTTTINPGQQSTSSLNGGPPIQGTISQTTFPKFDANGFPIQGVTTSSLPTAVNPPTDFLFNASRGLSAIAGQFAILTVPEMSATLTLLNEDSDAEFLANPRIVTADNQQAKIEIIRNQPVPQLNFNEQTATAVFGGFQDKVFGNKLIVRPSINKDNYITLSVKPEISNKVGDFVFTFAGANVTSPIIDTRSLDSNVLIRSGDTLAIGGLLSDAVSKSRTKVPILGDIPLLGNVFQSHDNERHKRNLLVFVTPTIIDPHYGTGLEDQVSGLHHTGEEYADPDGWRNNAKGAVRLIPTAHRPIAAEYPKPGMPPPPETATEVQFKSSAKDRDF